MFASLYITRCPVDRETAKARKFSLGNLEISSNSNSVFSKETVIGRDSAIGCYLYILFIYATRGVAKWEKEVQSLDS